MAVRAGFPPALFSVVSCQLSSGRPRAASPLAGWLVSPSTRPWSSMFLTRHRINSLGQLSVVSCDAASSLRLQVPPALENVTTHVSAWFGRGAAHQSRASARPGTAQVALTCDALLVGLSNTWEPIPTRHLQDPESKLHWPLEHLGTNSDEAPSRPRIQAPLASRTPPNQVSRGTINTKDPSSIGPSDTLKPSRPGYKQHPEL
jgi:hypothetical protein